MGVYRWRRFGLRFIRIVCMLCAVVLDSRHIFITKCYCWIVSSGFWHGCKITYNTGNRHFTLIVLHLGHQRRRCVCVCVFHINHKWTQRPHPFTSIQLSPWPKPDRSTNFQWKPPHRMHTDCIAYVGYSGNCALPRSEWHKWGRTNSKLHEFSWYFW